MIKTAKQIEGDIIALLCDSDLANSVNGKIYRFGHRPHNSKAEDIIVAFTTGIPDQIQTGIITLNIYVPDIEDEDIRIGVMRENERRCEELEIAASQWVESLTADKSAYKFTLQQTVYTEEEPEISQHFVVIKLKYKLFIN
ncbi:MAG: hypothetical protein LBL07_12555 [Tannerella sp.]|jgi:hypothetical protein|nr:hypothetical protein [Tannerella sp.]